MAMEPGEDRLVGKGMTYNIAYGGEVGLDRSCPNIFDV